MKSIFRLAIAASLFSIGSLGAATEQPTSTITSVQQAEENAKGLQLQPVEIIVHTKLPGKEFTLSTTDAKDLDEKGDIRFQARARYLNPPVEVKTLHPTR